MCGARPIPAPKLNARVTVLGRDAGGSVLGAEEISQQRREDPKSCPQQEMRTGREGELAAGQPSCDFADMPMTLEQIVEETKQWPAEAVAELVDRIMIARHGGIDPAVDAAWKAEIHLRIEDIESGRVQGVPLEEALAEARRLVGL